MGLIIHPHISNNQSNWRRLLNAKLYIFMDSESHFKVFCKPFVRYRHTSISMIDVKTLVFVPKFRLLFFLREKFRLFEIENITLYINTIKKFSKPNINTLNSTVIYKHSL